MPAYFVFESPIASWIKGELAGMALCILTIKITRLSALETPRRLNSSGLNAVRF
jgi:hypothetical protein